MKLSTIYLYIAGGSAAIINGTCHECLCKLITNATFFAVTCFHRNLTCQLHPIIDQNQSLAIKYSHDTSLYIRSADNWIPSTANTPASELGSLYSDAPVTTRPCMVSEYVCSFDSTFQDTSSTFYAIPLNNPGYSSSTITGYGTSLSLESSMNQSLSIDHPQPLTLVIRR